jgi:hypothetical protein
MATTLFLTEPEAPCLLDCACPDCGEPLAKGLVDLGEGKTVETIYCPFGNCDLRPYTF